MTADEALTSSSGDFTRNLVGYLPAEAAHALVETGEFDFFRQCAQGYVLKRLAGDYDGEYPVANRT